MESPYSVLGVSPDATLSQIETAFQRQWTFWNDLRSNANRAAEAEAMIARLEFAHAQALARFQGQEGSLVDPAPNTQGGFLENAIFASPGAGAQQNANKSACPKCGKRDNPPDADYCGNAKCDFELRPPCPKCSTRVPWHQGRCHKCGVVIEDFIAAKRRLEDQQRYDQEQQRQADIRSLYAKLDELKQDLFYVESRPTFWIWRLGRSGRILSKYGQKAVFPRWAPLLWLPGCWLLIPLAGGTEHTGYLLQESRREDYISPELLTAVASITIGVIALVAIVLVFIFGGAATDRKNARTAIHKQYALAQETLATYGQAAHAIPIPPRKEELASAMLTLFTIISLVLAFGQFLGFTPFRFTQGIGISPYDPPPPPASIDTTEEVFIPAGEFSMGSSDEFLAYLATMTGASRSNWEHESPQHSVVLDAYYIDKYEVTNARYQRCVSAGVCDSQRATLVLENTDSDNIQAEYSNFPVTGVTWFQAETFCQWEGKRLPTEAEWEKAAKGEDARVFPWGDYLPDKTLLRYGGRLSHVGSYPKGASPYGVMDMIGNVGEWVSDWYQADYYNLMQNQNPTGPIAGQARVIRGWGSLSRSSWDYMADQRTTSRIGHFSPDAFFDNVGFRCARAVER
jgi:formylglycine-generating enzyme required for sulfatase activity/ribosomal protein L40E